MVGVPYNPDNCTFVASQALNANQFNGVVPDAVNTSNHLLLWDFIDEKLYWVNSLTNIIEHELPDGSGGNNEEYIKNSVNVDENYSLSSNPTTFGANYIVLPAGTYMFDFECDYYMNNIQGSNYGISNFEIRTNTDPLITGSDISDIVIKLRQTKAGAGFVVGKPAVINQTVKTEAVTFASSFVVKSSAYLIAFPEVTGSQFINNLTLRAFKIK